MAFTADNFFSPKQIAEADFPTAFRGYEQEAVRIYLQDVADTLAQLQERQDRNGPVGPDPVSVGQLRELKKENAKLRSKLKALDIKKRNTSHVDLHDDQVAEVLGKEATRILEAARVAAAEIIARSHEEAASFEEQAQFDAEKIKEQASRVLDSKKAEAEKVAAKTVSNAEKQASRIKKTARSDYDRAKVEVANILSEAKRVLAEQESFANQRADQIIGDAEAHREKIISDLVHQRRSGSKDLNILLSTREKLFSSLTEARTQLDMLSSEIEDNAHFDSIDIELVGSFEDELEQTLSQLDSVLPNSDRQASLGSLTEELENFSIDQPDFLHDDSQDNYIDLEEANNEIPAFAEDASIDDYINLEQEKPKSHLRSVSNSKSKNGRRPIRSSVGVKEQPPVPDWDNDIFSDELDTADDLEVVFTETDPISNQDLNLNEVPEDEWEEVLSTVAGRSYGTMPDESRGDLPSGDSYTGRVPELFKSRDIALSRSGPELRRAMKRALNDDQSDILDRLRAGKGPIRVDELPSLEEQVNLYFDPLRANLSAVVQAGARAANGIAPESLIDSVTNQLSKHIVTRVRIPTVEVLENSPDNDRESVLDQVRYIYREFRNDFLLALLEDSLFELFALGHYIVMPDGLVASWELDPRLEPDPLCEINANTVGLKIGEIFPSGHNRPLSLPGCRCLVTASDQV